MDPAQLDQILANLVVNARDAIKSVGKITIETGKAHFDEDYCTHHLGSIPGKYIMIAVSDNGSGMDKETLANIFEPFFTTKPQGEGTGLGLATVYGIIKQNEGFINVYSEPGEGTTFRIYLPRLIDETNQPEDENEIIVAKNGTETILVVEDEAPLLALATQLIQNFGYTVLAANSPDKALEIARDFTEPIDLILTDVIMPEMSGRDLYNALTELRPSIKCIFMSGYTANIIAHHGILDEGVQFLQKPFTAQDLAKCLRQTLDG
jgi:CheY-like chemotaxis protein